MSAATAAISAPSAPAHGPARASALSAPSCDASAPHSESPALDPVIPHSEFPIPHSHLDDPSFAPFADLSGLLDLAVRAENRLRSHLNPHPKRLESRDINHTQAVVLSICRLTAVRKTLIEAWKSARTPISAPAAPRNPASNPDSYRSSSSDSCSTATLDDCAQGAPEISGTLAPASPPRFSRINSVHAIPVCPNIPNSKNLDLDLAKILSDLDKLEKNTEDLVRSIIPASRRSAASRLFPKMPKLPSVTRPRNAFQDPYANPEDSCPGAEPNADPAAPFFDRGFPKVSRALAAALSNSGKPAPPVPIVHPPPEP